MGKPLAILSVPFYRLNRVLLGEPVLGAIRGEFDIVVVSPFAGNVQFQGEFKAAVTRFVEFREPANVTLPLRKLFVLSELLRTLGYWRRLRKRGMAYYNANSYSEFGADGNDRPKAPAKRIVLWLTSLAGIWSGAWRCIDRLVGPSLFRHPDLEEFARRYERVTLIQSASWGMQDRMLAWLGRRNKWRTLLVPYTTDQLYCNGYLLSDFDAVCVQGPSEERFAREYHDVPAIRIVELGSAWFRHMEVIVERMGRERRPREPRAARVILMAGVSKLYFPQASEHMIVETLEGGIKGGNLGRARLIYRPVPNEEADFENIRSRWPDSGSVTLQFPQRACLGMSESTGSRTLNEELSEYIAQMGEVDIVITSGITSLSLDAAKMGIPSIAVFADQTGILKSRRTELLFDSNGRVDPLPALTVVSALEQLVSRVGQLLEDRNLAENLSRGLAADWDFPGTDFRSTLIRAMTG